MMNDLTPKSGFCSYVVSSSSESEKEDEKDETRAAVCHTLNKSDDKTRLKADDKKAELIGNEEKVGEKCVESKSESRRESANLEKNDKKSEKRHHSRSPDRFRRRSHSRERHEYKNWDGRGGRPYQNRYGSRHDYYEDKGNRHDQYTGGRRRDFDDKRGFYRSTDKRSRSPYNEETAKKSNFQEQKKQQQAQTNMKKFEEKSVKLKEMVEKRKMLWQQGNQEKKVADHWGAMLAACSDDKQAEKLKKLIGLKAGAADEHHHEEPGAQMPTCSTVAGKTDEKMQQPNALLGDATRRQQERLFNDLNVQYEMGRMSTHTHRGVGLGFASQLHEYTTQLHQPAVSNAPGPTSQAASGHSADGEGATDGRR